MQSNDPQVQLFGNTVAKLMQKERENKGLSKYEVSQRSGISDQAILYVETKRRTPSIVTLYSISKAMNIPLWKVVKEAEEIAESQE